MNRKIGLAGLVVILVIVVAWYALLWKPTTKSLDHARTALATQQAKLNQLSSQVASLQDEAKRLPSEKHKLAALEASVPTSVDVTGIIDQIHAVADRSGTNWLGVTQTASGPAGAASATPAASTTPAGKVSGLQQVQVTLTVSGSYRQLMSFLSGLGAMSRVAITQGLTIAGGSSPLQATVQAVAFYDPAPLPKPPTPAKAA